MFTERRVLYRYLLTVPPIIFLAEMVAHQVTTFVLPAQEGMLGAMADALIIQSIAMPALFALVVRPLHSALLREHGRAQERELAIGLEGRRQQFDAQLNRALELADTEEEALETARRALDRLENAPSVEMLLADSSQAHLRRALVSTTGKGCDGCHVESPLKCAAVRRAQSLAFVDTEHIDACPRLLDRPSGRLSAVCVPVSISGRAIGVLHATAPFDSPQAAQLQSPDSLRSLEVIAAQVGARVGVLRAMESSQLQAGTDPLTGLCNRRSFEHKLGEYIRKGKPYALSLGDLDHFKKLNDTHGHEVGDRALRVFSQVLKNTLRGEDIFCRFGGEEFAIMLAGVNAQEGARALDRVREALAGTMLRGSVPPFTVSFGIADSSMSPDREDLLRLADDALYAAKRAGRNRVQVAGEDMLQHMIASRTNPVPKEALTRAQAVPADAA